MQAMQFMCLGTLGPKQYSSRVGSARSSLNPAHFGLLQGALH